MTASTQAHDDDDDDSGWDHHRNSGGANQDGLGTEYNGGNDEGGSVPRQPNRKRSYQERSSGRRRVEYDDEYYRPYEYSSGGGDSGRRRATRPAGGAATPNQYRRWHHQQQPMLSAFRNSARAFVEDGPLAAMHELGTMGPLAIALLAVFLSRQGTRQMLIVRCRYLIDVLRGTFSHIKAVVAVGWDAVAALASIMTPLYGVDDDDSLCGPPDESSDVGALSGRGGRRRRRFMERGSDLANIPALEDVKLPDRGAGPAQDDDVGDDAASGIATKKGRRKKKRPCRLCGLVHTKDGRRMANGGYCHGIDPAFRQGSEYPSEWLVYDALSGVLSKELADRQQLSLPSSPPAPVGSKPSQSLQDNSAPEEKKEIEDD
mmetsp:Transcript_29835/g.87055  ORF Transcript_29835/g.87055 Transcript_29835/m.87055 type:complete len:374 (+) Transcript_29835:161-1282(+)